MFHLCADEYSGGEISRGGEEKKNIKNSLCSGGKEKKNSHSFGLHLRILARAPPPRPGS